jgi:hypothetical protein
MGFKKFKKKMKKSVNKTVKQENGGGGGGSEEKVFSIPFGYIKDHLSEDQQKKFCTQTPNSVYVRFNQPSCNPEVKDETEQAKNELEVCRADKESLDNKIIELDDKLTELESEIRKYVSVSAVESIMKDGFCAPYNVLNTKFENVKGELDKCQNAYNDRTTQLNGVYEKYINDVKKYHATIKEIIDGGDTHVINEEKQQIYKEESLMLQEKIRKNWRKLYIVLVILIAVIILCILKFFEFI